MAREVETSGDSHDTYSQFLQGLPDARIHPNDPALRDFLYGTDVSKSEEAVMLDAARQHASLEAVLRQVASPKPETVEQLHAFFRQACTEGFDSNTRLEVERSIAELERNLKTDNADESISGKAGEFWASIKDRMKRAIRSILSIRGRDVERVEDEAEDVVLTMRLVFMSVFRSHFSAWRIAKRINEGHRRIEAIECNQRLLTEQILKPLEGQITTLESRLLDAIMQLTSVYAKQMTESRDRIEEVDAEINEKLDMFLSMLAEALMGLEENIQVLTDRVEEEGDRQNAVEKKIAMLTREMQGLASQVQELSGRVEILEEENRQLRNGSNADSNTRTVTGKRSFPQRSGDNWIELNVHPMVRRGIQGSITPIMQKSRGSQSLIPVDEKIDPRRNVRSRQHAGHERLA